MKAITVVGAGLAGSEAAWQIAQRGIPVRLYEMRPGKTTPMHQTGDFAELVCSNSLGSRLESTAGGLLKKELELLGSLVIAAAEKSSVPAGAALAVDRREFSRRVTECLKKHPLVTIVQQECRELPPGISVIATGPLSSPGIVAALQTLTESDNLYFYDAAAPIVLGESVDYQRGFWAARYNRGSADYFNCPLSKAEYQKFWRALVEAEVAPLQSVEEGITVFEGCVPLEVLAARGEDVLRYGPFRPVGLTDKEGRRPYAVLQLRKENTKADLFNLVGCQTRLKWQEQRRVFRLIPALRNCEFARYGVMHRNTFINSPRVLNSGFQFAAYPHVFLAGQITGVEGYVESTASGWLAGVNAARVLQGAKPLFLPKETMLGSLAHYIATANPAHFQPMNANFGILPPLDPPVRGKKERRRAYADRALKVLEAYFHAGIS